jgi:hypothetical protein
MAIHRLGRLAQDWRELEESGTPLEPFEFRVGVNSNREVTIRQYETEYESGIRELRSGRIAYVISVFIRRNEPGKTTIRDFSLDVPWDNSVEWLDEGTGRNRKWYAFSKQTYPPPHEFARETVLNHRMKCTLSRGAFREGVLLAVGQVRPPEEYRHGGIIPITFTILDQWDRKLPAVFKLRLERCRALDEKMKGITLEYLNRRAKSRAEMQAALAKWDAEEISEPGNSPFDQREDRGPQRQASEVPVVEK